MRKGSILACLIALAATAGAFAFVPAYPDGRWMADPEPLASAEDAELETAPEHPPATHTPLGNLRLDVTWRSAQHVYWPSTTLPGFESRVALHSAEPAPPERIVWRTYWVVSPAALATQLLILWALLAMLWWPVRKWWLSAHA